MTSKRIKITLSYIVYKVTCRNTTNSRLQHVTFNKLQVWRICRRREETPFEETMGKLQVSRLSNFLNKETSKLLFKSESITEISVVE